MRKTFPRTSSSSSTFAFHLFVRTVLHAHTHINGQHGIGTLGLTLDTTTVHSGSWDQEEWRAFVKVHKCERDTYSRMQIQFCIESAFIPPVTLRHLTLICRNFLKTRSFKLKLLLYSALLSAVYPLMMPKWKRMRWLISCFPISSGRTLWSVSEISDGSHS